MTGHDVDFTTYSAARREARGEVPDPRLMDPAAEGAPSGRGFDHGAELARLDRLARLLDSRFGVPGTRISFGLDSIIGLVPGIGDALTLAPQAYLIWKARELGAPKRVIGRMAINTGIDTAVGSIPVLGDLFDVAFKANLRNLRLLKNHLEATHAPETSAEPVEPRV